MAPNPRPRAFVPGRYLARSYRTLPRKEDKGTEEVENYLENVANRKGIS